ncbi:L,D-transpeptidase family protein [Pontibacter sp. H259]|uniref:L,D-transpeptidase family protein n=1 Tax=Pontibacter sp. H259 TaxID=3133421 RepID=UPI0030BE6999
MFSYFFGILMMVLPLYARAQQAEPAWLNPTLQAERMQQAIELYTCIAGTNTWNYLPPDLKLSPGDTNLSVPKLQHNLLLTKDLQQNYSQPTTIYDSLLVQATMRFQSRHGLKPSGLIGPLTITELNMPPSCRLQLLTDNLHRWKASTTDFKFPTIIINIPAFQLYLVDSCVVPLQMRIITGKKQTPTYLNKTELLSIVVNPVWNLPRSISVNEIVPILQRNPSYLYKRHMRVYKDGRQLNPWRVNWKQVNASNYDFQITQLPGKQNELGTLKFLYNSKASQYMHDTPRKELFDYEPRDFSHGCVRLEKPYELALYLLQHRSGQTEEKARELLARWDRNMYIRIRKPMPLLILYQTCWVDTFGQAQFRKDVYGYESLKL